MGPRAVVVLDTNVLISAAGWIGPERNLLSICRSDLLQISISPDLLSELERVMNYPKLGFDEARKERFISQLLRHAIMVNPDQRLSVIAADETDNRVLECALASNARWIVSGDKHLISLGSFAGIPIITTAEALRLLDNESSDPG